MPSQAMDQQYGPCPPTYQLTQSEPVSVGHPVSLTDPYSQVYRINQPEEISIIQSHVRSGQRVYVHYARRTSKILGIGRICCGILSILFILAAITVDDNREMWGPRTVTVAGSGVRCGLAFILAGSFGVAVATRKTVSLIITNMVLSIVSVSIFGLTYVALSATGLMMVNDNYGRYCHYCGEIDPDYNAKFIESNRKGRALLAVFGVMTVLGLVECVCDIWSSVICCKAVCCGYSTVPEHYIGTLAGRQGKEQTTLYRKSSGLS